MPEQLSDKYYVQKSKLFLLPLIEVKRDPNIAPLGPFIRDSLFTEDDFRLILPFERDESSEFYYYEKELLDSPHLDTDSYYETKRYQVYVYNLEKYADDYRKFLEGKYTTFSNSAKTLINIYRGRIFGNKFYPHPKIDCYLNPAAIFTQLNDKATSYYDESYKKPVTYRTKVSHELGISMSLLEEVKELLDPPNLERETFNEDRLSKTSPRCGDSESSLSI